MKQELEMRIDTSALEHLGMNLYSNTPAVVSEVIANAWDADAESVSVRLDTEKGLITIVDDGVGMTRDQVINRFLVVGYRKRDHEDRVTSKFQRSPMGRKGIGKLSCFSIADAVTIYTRRNGEKTAFKMDAQEIRRQFKEGNEGNYKPKELEDSWCEDLQTDGTCVVLTKLKKNITKLSRTALRQRVARRFAVIGSQFKFQVEIEGEQVSPRDRGYLDKVQYLWTYGKRSIPLSEFSGLSKTSPVEDRTNCLKAYFDSADRSSAPMTFSGWIGTVDKPNQLKDGYGQNLNQLAVFMRGKMAQADILGELAEKRIFVSYVVGEIHCEFLDLDESLDIATSNRQAFKIDDERYELLSCAVRKEIAYIASRWNNLRVSEGAAKAVNEVPELLEWLESLHINTRKKAERWIGRLNVLRVGSSTDKRELLKASVLAFESFRRKEMLESLDDITDTSIEAVLQLFTEIDDLQLSYYGQIVQMRLKVLSALTEKLEEDAYEKELQKHIYDHLWLLDPSWERVMGTEAIERRLGTFLNEDTRALSDEEKYARIDIGYRTTAGRHVIIEMKRRSVATPFAQLLGQIQKYQSGALKLLRESDSNGWQLEIICLVGKPPPEWYEVDGPKKVQDVLKVYGARMILYDQLLNNTQRAYMDYIESNKDIDKLAKIFQAIDDFSAVEQTVH